MLELKYDNGLPLPQEVQNRVNNFIDNLAKVPWVKPNKELKKEDVEKQALFTLECFGVKAEIEYRSLVRQEDWVASMDASMDASWVASRVVSMVASELLAEDLPAFSDKYPNGAFKQLFKLWEMGLYPVGVLEKTKTFVIYVPLCDTTLPDDFK